MGCSGLVVFLWKISTIALNTFQCFTISIFKTFTVKSVLWIRHCEWVLLLDSDRIDQSECVYWNAHWLCLLGLFPVWCNVIKRCVYAGDFWLKNAQWDRFPVVSVLNKFMKMYSNTISIVHSNFRRKESLYLFIQALFLSWTDTGFRDLQFS